MEPSFVAQEVTGSDSSLADVEFVINTLNSSNGVLSSYMISNLPKVKTYLTQVAHPAIKNIISRLDSQGLSSVELAHSLEAVRDYISGHVVPFQSCIEEVRSDRIQFGLFNQQLFS